MKQLIKILAVVAIVILSCKKDKKQLASLSTTAPSNITATGVTTGGNITDDGNSGISKRGVAWATHSNPTVGDSITNNGSGVGSFTSTISGLSANMTYYFRAYAINESGTAYGNEVSITTMKGVPSVTTSPITNIQPLSASTGGTISSDGGAAVTERGVVYATSTNPTTSNFKITSGTGSGTYTITLSPLASQTTYFARAYAINSYGTAYGNEVQFNAASANTVTDIDGNVYSYVDICGLKWISSNLKVTKYKNGDALSDGSVAGFDWTSSTGAYTYPNFTVDAKTNNASHGKLYNLASVRDNRGICPTGWHVATDDNFKAIELCQGADPATVGVIGAVCCIGQKFLAGGSSGLDMQLAGYAFYYPTGMIYSVFGQSGFYWTGTPSPVNPALNRYRSYKDPSLNFDPQYVPRSNADNQSGYAVRCVKD